MLVQPLAQYIPGALVPALVEGPTIDTGFKHSGQLTIFPIHKSLIIRRCFANVSALVLLISEKSLLFMVSR